MNKQQCSCNLSQSDSFKVMTVSYYGEGIVTCRGDAEVSKLHDQEEEDYKHPQD